MTKLYVSVKFQQITFQIFLLGLKIIHNKPASFLLDPSQQKVRPLRCGAIDTHDWKHYFS